MHFVLRDDVVLRGGIVVVDSYLIRGTDQSRIGSAEHTVSPGIMDLPGKLLGGDMDDHRVIGHPGEKHVVPDTLAHEYEHNEDYGRNCKKNSLGFRIVMPVRRVLVILSAVSGGEISK